MSPVGRSKILASQTPRTTVCLALLPLVAVTILASACGGSVGGGGDIDHATGSADVVIRVESGGGFIPVDFSLTELPEFTLYGDGTVIVEGPMIEIWPQPAMPNLQQASISEEVIQKVLTAADAAGLFADDVDYGIPSVADASTTTITVNADGQTYTSSIYALGIAYGDGFALDAAEMGLTSEQAQLRQDVMDFTISVGDLETFISDQLDWQQYSFTALAVFSLPYDERAPYDPEIPPNHLDWPLSDLSTGGEAVQPEGYRRVVVTGADLDTLRPLLAEATRITLWKSGSAEYYLYFRPLLPDEI